MNALVVVQMWSRLDQDINKALMGMPINVDHEWSRLEQATMSDRAAHKGDRWRNVKVLAEDFAFLETRGKDASASASGLLRELIAHAKGLASTVPVGERLVRIEAQLQSLDARIAPAYRTRFENVEGGRFEDADRFQLLAVLLYLRTLTRHGLPEEAEDVEDRAEQELLRLCGEDAPASDDMASHVKRR